MSEPTHDLLQEIVDSAEYRPNYKLWLDENEGTLCLLVLAVGYDSYHVDRGSTYRVVHSFQVPPASYNRQSWTRWVLDRLISMETHEACEFLVVDGRRPFAPNHGPGWDPYAVRELNTVEAAETTFRGERREGTQGAST